MKTEEEIHESEKQEILDALHECFLQACYIEGEGYDHMYLSSYQLAQKVLLKYGMIDKEECYRK